MVGVSNVLVLVPGGVDVRILLFVTVTVVVLVGEVVVSFRVASVG